jgi:hypothetical protein
MLEIKEINTPEGYYKYVAENGEAHVYYIQHNKLGIKILNYVAPLSVITKKRLLGNIDIQFSFAINKEYVVVNHDGIFKQIAAYKIGNTCFNSNFKGYYAAYQEKNRSGIGTVYKDTIKYGSGLRIIVNDAQVFPEQFGLYSGKVINLYGLQGTYAERNKEFDISGQRGKAQHLLIRVEYLRKVTPEELPYKFLYQKIVNVKENRTIVYTVVPITIEGKMIGLKDMFPVELNK